MAEAPQIESVAAQRVRRFLEGHGLEGGIVHFERSTETALMAAEALHCELGQIVKSLVFVVDGSPVLALVAGDRKGDAKAIAAHAGGARASFASPDVVCAATGYTVGGVSPYDLPAGLTVLVDDSLMRFDVLYTAGGTASSLVRIGRDELIGLIRGRLATFSR